MTFCVMAHHTWNKVLRSRCENRAVGELLVNDEDTRSILSSMNNEPWKEDSAVVFSMLREMNQRFFHKYAGIEYVLVPAGGANKAVEGKHAEVVE